MIVIYPEHWQTLNIHAEKTYPEECCGLLLGKINRLLAEVGNSESELRKSASKKHFCKRFNQQVKIVTQVWPTPNSWNGLCQKLTNNTFAYEKDTEEIKSDKDDKAL